MSRVGASIILFGITMGLFAILLQLRQDRPNPGAVCPACGRVMP
jgi:hypothetical protein